MCIVIYKPAGVDLPDDDILHTCWTNNPDGAGFMYPRKGRVHIRKGYMSRKALMDALAQRSWRDVPLVIHFRIMTHGARNPANCHPFPVTRAEKKLSAVQSDALVGLAHNGIIGNVRGTKNYSDTFIFVRDYAARIAKSPTFYKDEDSVALLEQIADSKLALMSSDGHVELIGKFTDSDGVYYSNTTYQNVVHYGAFGWNDFASCSQPWEFPKKARTTTAKTAKTTPSYLATQKRVAVAFLPLSDDIVLWNNDTKDLDLNIAERLYCYDSDGQVYEFIEKRNGVIAIPDTVVLNADTLDTLRAPATDRITFALLSR